jgi:hypothetical protein
MITYWGGVLTLLVMFLAVAAVKTPAYDVPLRWAKRWCLGVLGGVLLLVLALWPLSRWWYGI